MGLGIPRGHQLPVSHYEKHQISKTEDEDLAEEFHLYLQSLNKKFLLALDVVQYSSTL